MGNLMFSGECRGLGPLWKEQGSIGQPCLALPRTRILGASSVFLGQHFGLDGIGIIEKIHPRVPISPVGQQSLTEGRRNQMKSKTLGHHTPYAKNKVQRGSFYLNQKKHSSL